MLYIYVCKFIKETLNIKIVFTSCVPYRNISDGIKCGLGLTYSRKKVLVLYQMMTINARKNFDNCPFLDASLYWVPHERVLRMFSCLCFRLCFCFCFALGFRKIGGLRKNLHTMMGIFLTLFLKLIYLGKYG